MRKYLLGISLLVIMVLDGLNIMASAESEKRKFFGPIGILCRSDSLDIFHYGSMGHIRGVHQKIVGDKLYLYVKCSSFGKVWFLPEPKPFNSHITIPKKVNQVLLNRERTVVWDRVTDTDGTTADSR